jgi:23S rRNA-/tRNA-specific pseudouridylate synthase
MTQSKLDAIIYEDEHMLIFDKPSGMLTHRMPGVKGAALALQVVRDICNQRVYPVHRLDRATSGLIVFAKSSEDCKLLQSHWSEATKVYTTLARSDLQTPGDFTFDLKNEKGIPKAGHTRYRPLWSWGEYTCFSVQILTGRTHQIRRHFSRRVMNLVGDTTYGKGRINNLFREQYNFHRLCLHKCYLKIKHPHSKQDLQVYSPLPKEISSLFNQLNPKEIFPYKPFYQS